MSIRKFIAAVATLMTIAFVSGCYSTPVSTDG